MIPRICRRRIKPSIITSSLIRTYSIRTNKLNSTSLKSITTITTTTTKSFFTFNSHESRKFSTGSRVEDKVVKPFLLADIGEGITECEIVKW